MTASTEAIGQRSLAVIVFTDVVNFSRLANANEERALALMQRDSQLMTEISTKYSGTVLKSLGDGLLIYFNSAVQAVNCAEEIQRTIAERSVVLPPDDVLQHRIGIHLGDVFIKDNDVMGDGVNIAARLQAEAEPGGICISQTVYEVIKNQLALQTAYMGERDLKNIRGPVPVYRILVSGSSESMPTTSFIHPLDRRQAKRRRMILAVVLLAVIAVGLLWFFKHWHEQQKVSSSKEFVAQNLPEKNLQEPKESFKDIWPAKEREFLKKYDFQGALDFLKNYDNPHAQRLSEKFQQLAELRQWFESELSNSSETNPIKIAIPSREGPKPVEFWRQADGTLAIRKDNAVHKTQMENLQPLQLGAMIGMSLRNSQMQDMDKKHQLVQAMKLFANEYRFPQPQRQNQMRDGQQGQGPNQDNFRPYNQQNQQQGFQPNNQNFRREGFQSQGQRQRPMRQQNQYPRRQQQPDGMQRPPFDQQNRGSFDSPPPDFQQPLPPPDQNEQPY